MSTVTYLPYLRRGLAATTGAPPDPLSGTLPGSAPVTAFVEIEGERAERTIKLLGPPHVRAIDPTQIWREVPAPDTTGHPPNQFAYLELTAPDLPWLFTPAAPEAQGRLRPWLVLIVVDEADPGIELVGGELTVADPAAQLPDLTQSWAWAHVQTSIPLDDITLETEQPGEVIARLICPRYLERDHAYLAALVPAFMPADGDDSIEPSWDASSGPVTLTAYHSWRFTTGEADFETLCRRLEPATDATRLGIHTVNLAALGIEVEWPDDDPPVIEMGGALWDIGVAPRRLDNDERAAFADAVVPLVNAGAGRVEMDREEPMDPLVAPPFHGAWAARETEVPGRGWLREINALPERRAAAGLGAEVVRTNQQALITAAWNQAGELAAVNDELNRAALAATVANAWTRRVGALDDSQVLQAVSRVLSFATDDAGHPAVGLLRASEVPSAAVSPTFARLSRTTRHSPPFATTTAAFLTASGATADSELRACFDYSRVALPDGGQGPDDSLLIDLATQPTPEMKHELQALIDVGLVASRLGGRPTPGSPRSRSAHPLAPTSIDRQVIAKTDRSTDVSALATAVVANLAPVAAIAADLSLRVPALDLGSTGTIPARVREAPYFPGALWWDLVAIDPELVMPGVGEFPNNRVRLLSVNEEFVAAFLVGANHEMASELLWHEYPTGLGATFFDRFFERSGGDTDIDSIARWDPASRLEDQVGSSGTSTVLLIRGDLVRHHPGVQIYFLDPSGGDPGTTVLPTFTGRFGIDSLVVGFDVDPDVVLGHQGGPVWLVAIEERWGDQAFGLDEGDAVALTTWADLSWSHFDGGPYPDATTIPVLGTTPMFDGATWGYNSAHIARATYQQPFRLLFPADHLIGS